MRGSSQPITADWTLVQDEHGRQTVVGLKLSDLSGSVEDRFTLQELRNVDRLEFRLSRLWRDLLQVRSDKQIATLKQLLEQYQGD